MLSAGVDRLFPALTELSAQICWNPTAPAKAAQSGTWLILTNTQTTTFLRKFTSCLNACELSARASLSWFAWNSSWWLGQGWPQLLGGAWRNPPKMMWWVWNSFSGEVSHCLPCGVFRCSGHLGSFVWAEYSQEGNMQGWEHSLKWRTDRDLLFLCRCWQGLLSSQTDDAALLFLLQNCPWRGMTAKRIAHVYVLTDVTWFLPVLVVSGKNVSNVLTKFILCSESRRRMSGSVQTWGAVIPSQHTAALLCSLGITCSRKLTASWPDFLWPFRPVLKQCQQT